MFMNIWIIGKYPVKDRYLKKKVFTVLNTKDITDSHYPHAKRFCKDFEMKI